MADVSLAWVSPTVASIEIRRPPNNHIDADLLQQIADHMHNLDQEGRCRAIVLCSEGKHFCAGANLASRDATDDVPRTRLYEQAVRLFTARLPVVASVQGAAVGGGLGLALAADFRVASAQSRFSANFARLGYHHGFGLTTTLPRAVGFQHAAEMLYTGRRVDGTEAFRIGLCDRIADMADMRRVAYELAADIAASGPLAVRAIRQTLRGPIADAVRAALERETSEQAKLQRTRDFEEGIAAMAARRPPRFEGT